MVLSKEYKMREENHTMDELVFLPDRKSVIFHNFFFWSFVSYIFLLSANEVAGRWCFQQCLSFCSGDGWVCLVPDPFGGNIQGWGQVFPWGWYVQGAGRPERMGIPEGGVGYVYLAAANTHLYGWQAGGTHPTGMLSCNKLLFLYQNGQLWTIIWL